MKNLGKLGKDKVTGFEGIITAYVVYLTGCAQYGLTPPAINGETKSTNYFDTKRIDMIGDGVTISDVQDEKDPGGPNRDCPK